MSVLEQQHSPEDAILAKRAMQGDEDALRLLIGRYSDMLVRFAVRFTKNKDDAEDLVQETFIRMYANLHKLDLTRPLKPWLYRVCGNLCRNFARDKKSINFTDLASDQDDGEVLPSFAENIVDPEADPLRDTQRNLDSERIREALAEIPEKYRIVLSLFYSDGLSYEQIGDVLGLPLNTVRTHLRRAKDHLLKELQSPPPT